MTQKLVVTGATEMVDPVSMYLHRLRRGGDEPGFADATPRLKPDRYPLLVCQAEDTRDEVRLVLDGWRRRRGAIKAGFDEIAAINLGVLDDTTALAHIVRTGVLWPEYRDPWVLLNRIGQLVKAIPGIKTTRRMAEFLGVPAQAIEEAKAFSRLETDSVACKQYDARELNREELLILSQIPDRRLQDETADKYQVGLQSTSRLKSIVEAVTGQPIPKGTWAPYVLPPSMEDSIKAIRWSIESGIDAMNTYRRREISAQLADLAKLVDPVSGKASAAEGGRHVR